MYMATVLLLLLLFSKLRDIIIKRSTHLKQGKQTKSNLHKHNFHYF